MVSALGPPCPSLGPPRYLAAGFFMNEKYQATSSTVIRAIANISTSVLSTLDEYGSGYFDYCEIESELLQKKIEAAIREGARRLAEALATM